MEKDLIKYAELIILKGINLQKKSMRFNSRFNRKLQFFENISKKSL